MSILIKGIDMPKYESLTIKIMPSGAVRDQYGRLDERVKAVEVPRHGRLIDADNLIELCEIMTDKCGETGESVWGQYQMVAEDLPTIIEAEE